MTGPAGPLRRLSVVVPAFEEERRIAATVTELRAALEPALGPNQLEIVVVDDGSRDATARAAEAAGADVVIRLPVNRGKGGAVRAGVLAANGAVIAFTDADLSYPPAQLVRFLDQVESGSDVVVGSRRHIGTRTLVRARRLREVSGRVFNLVTRPVLQGGYGDTQCGLKAFQRDAARRIFSAGRLDGFAFDVEVFLLAERFGSRVTQVPVDVRAATGTTVRIGIDAVRMMRDVLRLRRWARSGVYDTATDPPKADDTLQ